MTDDPPTWADYTVAAEGAVVTADGYYACATCGTRLEPVGEIDRDRDVPHAKWRCPPCRAETWISLRGPRP
jgi:DNA-directed RNA polymerase subunit RPC12/RpoP